jgi:Na+/melibiose symporter-like transporter
VGEMVATYAYPATEFILFYLQKDNLGFMIFAVVIMVIAIANCLFTFKNRKEE